MGLELLEQEPDLDAIFVTISLIKSIIYCRSGYDGSRGAGSSA
jgi:hypothetical protein